MAKAELMNGVLRNISGTISKRTYRDKDGVHTVRTLAKVVNGKQRIYLRDYKPRATQPSEAELAARQRFSECAVICKNLTEDERMAYHREWIAANYRFNGKKYATLRGYIIARLFAETPSDANHM